MEINGIEYVDLDLPSGTLWASCNLGAEHEWEYGKYYQWGDTIGYYCGQGSEEHCCALSMPFVFGIVTTDTNYAMEFRAITKRICRNGVLHKKYDAAYQATNGQAHIPTKEQLEELVANTIKKSKRINHVDGCAFISKKDMNKSIFLPYGGFMYKSYKRGGNNNSWIWSSSIDSQYNAYNLSCASGDVEGAQPVYGQNIRSVICKLDVKL